MSKPIYLDYAATTPADEQVVAKMLEHLSFDSSFGNASSAHHYGWQAENAIESSRLNVSRILNCSDKDLVFTSGATEANNLAIKGIVDASQDKGRHIITSSAEHKSVLDTCKYLEKSNFKVTYLTPDIKGRIDLNDLSAALRNETVLVSLMHVNNETGTTEDVATISKLLNEAGVIFHVDATQSVGKLPIDLEDLQIDFLSFSAHKFYGPKGIGGLFIRNRSKTKISPLFHGGGQGFGIRPGTYPTYQIVGLAKALELAEESRIVELNHSRKLRQSFVDIVSDIDGVSYNGDQSSMLPNIINLSFSGVDSQTLLTSLQHEIAFASGSACTSGAVAPSHVLQAMRVPEDVLSGAVRISFGRYTTVDDIQGAAEKICQEVKRIRQMELN